ncbi:DUF4926 domain-containing protein [Gloeobacter violaceus]|uniref:Gsr4185 protein n=1 Tax=Gloeobacter violaceus (strain ATCC 29082 / PCC 7421) TaxID=251221 RepID=Q7NDP8_GLOVI|nr:DUF4926 domain-containing protein [Gloeobacter violaceus]BAC92126.1 gsr4185 [Gloeobacter violaceus PCC 7421]
MNIPARLLDVVELIEDLPKCGLYRGERGTIVEILSSDVYLVEFSNADGCIREMPDVYSDQFKVVYQHLREEVA